MNYDTCHPDIDEAYIAITGNIASGKSNLAKIIELEWKYRRITEEVNKPVLDKFYTNIRLHSQQTQYFYISSQTQNFFISSRGTPLIEANIVGGLWVSDFVFGVDSTVYARNLLEEGNLTPEQYQRIVEFEEGYHDKIRHPDLLLYLETDIKTLQYRIEKRGRPEEAMLLTPKGYTYLAHLEELHQQAFKNYPGKKARIKTDNLALVGDFNKGHWKPTHTDHTLAVILEFLHREYHGTPFEYVLSLE